MSLCVCRYNRWKSCRLHSSQRPDGPLPGCHLQTGCKCKCAFNPLGGQQEMMWVSLTVNLHLWSEVRYMRNCCLFGLVLFCLVHKFNILKWNEKSKTSVISSDIMSLCVFCLRQTDQLDSFCGKQKENVPPFNLDMVRSPVFNKV